MTNFNTITDQVFSVKNQQLLEEHKDFFKLISDEWAGFQQWRKAGRKVRKGAKACQIKIVCTKKMKNKEGEEEKKAVIKNLYVFNKEMTEAIEK